ncbi:hypothetical protein [Erythrobacter sp.]|jgi:ElaB/YqjD/DUF883 family membrane-anchored ribosome-binding protein|uniref:hypothetical protein n=1 Tax=Erythrobacter sp. TaxID=1042 RepID=UPI002EA68D7E|nr:hypothetical protein [Erythrobacter sp.]
MNDTTTGETTWEKTADAAHAGSNGHDKRDELRAKIEASERRIAERTLADDARDAAVAARDYTRAHPLTVVAGAIGIGILIGLATPPGRRAASRAASATAGAVGGAANAAGSAAKRGSETLFAPFMNALTAYVLKLVDEALSTAEAAQDRLEDLSDSAEAAARKARREAGYRAGNAADSARDTTRRTKRKASRAVRDIKGRIAG